MDEATVFIHGVIKIECSTCYFKFQEGIESFWVRRWPDGPNFQVQFWKFYFELFKVFVA